MLFMHWTIYHNPKCSKSRQALAFLLDHQLEPVVVDYIRDGVSAEQVTALIQLSRLSPADFVRVNEPEFASFKDTDLSSASAVAQMIHQSPRLLQRPVVQHKNRVIIAREPDVLAKLFTISA